MVVKSSFWRGHTLTVRDVAFNNKIDCVRKLLGDTESQRASQLHHWVKRNKDFDEWVDW